MVAGHRTDTLADQNGLTFFGHLAKFFLIFFCHHVSSWFPPSSDYDELGQSEEEVHRFAPTKRRRTSAAAHHTKFSP